MDAAEESVFDPYVSSLLDMVLLSQWEEIAIHLSSPQEALPLKILGLILCALLESSDTRPELIQLLVDTAQTAVRQRDMEGLLPIEILTQNILMKEERLRYITHHPVSYRTGRDLEANWECAYILVRAAAQGTQGQGIESSPYTSESHLDQRITGLSSNSHGVEGDEDEDDHGDGDGTDNNAAIIPTRKFMLHACLKANDIPLALIERAMKRYHDELDVIDELGDLPLHLVAAQGQAADDADDLLGEILNAYPPAACARNNIGAMPLDLAIASGRRWETGIGKLLQVNPEALVESAVSHIPDNLYPLAFAILLQHDAASLVFGMLTAKPGLVRSYRATRLNASD